MKLFLFLILLLISSEASVLQCSTMKSDTLFLFERLDTVSLEGSYADSLFNDPPSPFGPEIHLSFSIQKDGYVKVELFDKAGRYVANLFSSDLKAGKYKLHYDFSKLSSGYYIYELRTGNSVKRLKFTLVR
jgi:hypothetical protein